MNVVKAPQLNPIEIVFGMLKQTFRKLRLEQMVLNLIVSQHITVRIAIERLDASKFAGFANTRMWSKPTSEEAFLLIII